MTSLPVIIRILCTLHAHPSNYMRTSVVTLNVCNYASSLADAAHPDAPVLAASPGCLNGSALEISWLREEVVSGTPPPPPPLPFCLRSARNRTRPLLAIPLKSFIYELQSHRSCIAMITQHLNCMCLWWEKITMSSCFPVNGWLSLPDSDKLCPITA